MNFMLGFPIKDNATSFLKTMVLDNFDYDHPPNNGICVQTTPNYLTSITSIGEFLGFDLR
jgi:hypothetical protein